MMKGWNSGGVAGVVHGTVKEKGVCPSLPDPIPSCWCSWTVVLVYVCIHIVTLVPSICSILLPTVRLHSLVIDLLEDCRFEQVPAVYVSSERSAAMETLPRPSLSTKGIPPWDEL